MYLLATEILAEVALSKYQLGNFRVSLLSAQECMKASKIQKEW